MLPSCTACGQSFIVQNQIDRHVCSAMDQIASFNSQHATYGSHHSHQISQFSDSDEEDLDLQPTGLVEGYNYGQDERTPVGSDSANVTILPRVPTPKSPAQQPKQPESATAPLEIVALDTQLVTVPVLKSYNVVVNTHVPLFICQVCEKGYSWTGKGDIIAHLSAQHGLKVSAPTAKFLQPLPKNMTSLLPSGRPLWLSPRPTAGGQTYIRNHIVAKHAAEQAAQPQSPVHPIHTQRLNSAIFKTHVRVRKPSPSPNLDAPSNSTNFISQFESFHAFPPNPPQTIPNSRLISPWLKRCRWHLLVGSKDHLSLIDLVKTPGADDPLKWIPPLALQYYKQTSQLPDITHENVLHLINTSDATRGINHTPFQDVHQPETTHKQYSYVLARLLSALVRSPEGPNSLPLSIPLQKALCVFVEAKDLDSLQLVLEQLFFVEWSPTVQCPFPDPTLCFLAFINIKRKGSSAALRMSP
ncbi:helicase domain-containing protein [Coprinopsis cinerea AmutBmut pab1-1]|nr:helicase domain-containing protein [Coprinopsis cinerea AmutBmut pab1-1]